MKNTLCLLTLFFYSTAYAQNKDRRAELDIIGRVTEICVAPDEKIWLTTATGNTYYTVNINSNWHNGPLTNTSSEFLNGPNLDRISFFNKDTAIITGYISYNSKEYRKNGYYLTTNGGETMKLRDYGGNAWIYCIHTNKNGQAWMGGANKEIYYSSDFGQNWKPLKIPYQSSNRIYSIYMIDAKEGVLGSDDNEILYTKDNWATSLKIPTPLDQKKHVIEETGGNRISDITIWDKYLVAKQSGVVFYSNRDSIDWKRFPVRVHNFAMDEESGILYAITDSLKVSYFTNPLQPQLLSNKKLTKYPINIKAVNGSVYIFSRDNTIYKVNKNEFISCIPYTNDSKISEPAIERKGRKMIWGISGKQIYLADDGNRDWYRENAVDFFIEDIKLIDDSTALLWDGKNQNYLYSLKNHTLQNYDPQLPLNDFISAGLKTFTISSGSRGCYHRTENHVTYNRAEDSFFTTGKVYSSNYKSDDGKNYNNKKSIPELTDILSAINLNPSHVPSIKDFKISDVDKKNYLDMVKREFENEKQYGKNYTKTDMLIFSSVPDMLDTLDNTIIATVLNKGESFWSTTTTWFTITLVNQNNDTLNIWRASNYGASPWNLPWQFEYKNVNFACYNLNFSRYINSSVPDDFMGKTDFDNKYLLWAIAKYLNRKEE